MSQIGLMSRLLRLNILHTSAYVRLRQQRQQTSAYVSIRLSRLLRLNTLDCLWTDFLQVGFARPRLMMDEFFYQLRSPRPHGLPRIHLGQPGLAFEVAQRWNRMRCGIHLIKSCFIWFFTLIKLDTNGAKLLFKSKPELSFFFGVLYSLFTKLMSERFNLAILLI